MEIERILILELIIQKLALYYVLAKLPVDAGADFGLTIISSLSITTGLLYLTKEKVVPTVWSSMMLICFYVFLSG